MVVLGGGAVFYERGTPVLHRAVCDGGVGGQVSEERYKEIKKIGGLDRLVEERESGGRTIVVHDCVEKDVSVLTKCLGAGFGGAV